MRYIWIVLLGVVLLGLAFGPKLLTHVPPADEELKIISPHWDGIRHEFGHAFESWYFEKTGKRIHVVWLNIGGTGDIKRWLGQRFAQTAGGGVEVDILFGGGMDMLPKMADDKNFEPYQPLPEILKAIPPTVNGQLLRDKQFRYHAACLSMFGLVYNKNLLGILNFTAPKTFDDLGTPQMQSWTTCGDPSSAGSLHASFEIVLQGEGWERGWSSILHLAANTRAFNEGATSIPRDVSLGQAFAGPCIDFYATAPARRQGADFLQLVVPDELAVATPDCIAILRRPPNPAAANAFMEFVLSETGQRLWYQPRGTPGGPVEYDLDRLPVLPGIYEKNLPTHTASNPFKVKPPFTYDGKKAGQRWGTLDNLWTATLLYSHEPLWNAWSAVIQAGRVDDLGAALGRVPFSEAKLAEISARPLTADQRNALKNRWSTWARDWYVAIQHAAEIGAPVPVFTSAPED